jgi:hypothetical protein
MNLAGYSSAFAPCVFIRQQHERLGGRSEWFDEENWRLLFFLRSVPLFSQTNAGELGLLVADPSGATAGKALVNRRSEGSEYNRTLVADDSGVLNANRLPFGEYHVIDTLISECPETGFEHGRRANELRTTGADF